MPKVQRQVVRDNIAKCQWAALAAVEAYNKPGPRFRTAHYLVMICIAWTALFHAIIYKRGRRPWYRSRGSGTGKGIRYQKVDGEPRHWDLAECVSHFHGGRNPPERRNLEFLMGLRNKIEHRHLPALDPSLYGECQAALLNLEELLVGEFGAKYALEEQLAVSLQFSKTAPEQKRTAARSLATGAAKSVVDYIERFRGRLPSTALNSMKYSYNVFLVPKLSNRESAADAAVEFIRVDEASAEEIERLSKLNVLIREKHIPIANLDLVKPSQVVEALRERVPYLVSLNAHADAWKFYKARPEHGARHPDRTKQEYCIFDKPHRDYLYTTAWIERLAVDFSDENRYRKITGRNPKPK